MIYEVEKQIIDRYDMPCNSSIDKHIKSIHVEKLFKFDSCIVPEIGEILVYNEENYIISKKIRLVGSGLEEERIILRVKDYSDLQLNSSSGWHERVPLFIGNKE